MRISDWSSDVFSSDLVVNGWSVPTQYVEWDLKSSARIIAEHDVAVIPVVSNPYTVCKTNNRLVFALHLGLPVVADPIPSYQAFSEACVLRSEARRVGKECVSTCRYRWWQYHKKKKHKGT